MSELATVASELTLRLARASVEAAVVIGLVALICRLLPGLPPAFRCALWWLASAKLLLALAPLPALPLPLLPAPEPSALIFDLPAGVEAPSPDSIPSPAARSRGWRDLAPAFLPWLGLVWVALAAWSVLRAGRALARLRRVVTEGAPVADRAVAGGFRALAARLGLVPPPELRASPAIDTPQAVGLLRPAVLLPAASWSALAPGELEMTLCHELVHLKRRDLWLGLVPALAEKLFFFHPFAALAARQYVFAREEACDAEVLRVLGSAPRDYGRLLVRWSAHLRETGLAAAGVASPATHLKRRLLMLQNHPPSRRGLRAAALVASALMLVALVPYRIVAQPATSPVMPWIVASPVVASFSDEAAPTPAPTPTPAAPAARPGRPIPPTPAVAPVPGTPRPGAPPAPVAPAPRAAALPAPGAAPAIAAVPAPAAAPTPYPRLAGVPAPAAPLAPAAPPAPPLAPAGDWSDDEGLVIFGPDHRHVMGSPSDVKAARRHQRGDEELLYYRKGDDAWVIRDAALVRQAEGFFEPMSRLGEEMGRLGAGQGGYGARQGEFGARQAELGVRQAEIGLEIARKAAELASVAMEASRAEGAEERRLEAEQRKLDAEIDALSERMEQLGREQEKFGAEQEALGREQEKLGEQMEKLGEEMERMAEEAQRRLASLIDRSVANGTAEKVE